MDFEIHLYTTVVRRSVVLTKAETDDVDIKEMSNLTNELEPVHA